MKVVFLAAGAGGMYCGSCLRDNRVAATLLEQGRDVMLIPLYTPIRTDEVDVSQRRVFYGGINVYLEQKSALFRRLPRWAVRWLDAPGLLRRAMRLAGNTSPEGLGALTVSVLRGEDGAQRKELDQLIDALGDYNPDVVILPNLMFAGMARRLKSQLSAKVLCTLSGEDIFIDRLPNPFREGAMELIRAYGQDVDGFVAVTDYFAQHATNHFGLPSDRVHVVPMGVRVDDAGEPAMLPIGSFTIGYLARVCEEKGLDRLCDALIALRRAGRDCRVRAAGYLAPADRSYLDRIRTKVELAGIGDAFEYVGEVDRPGKSAFLRSLHVLSVPTVYHEAKGLYVLEAMACGVPVVQPDHGSFPEIVRATGGGLLYDPSQPDALAEGIAQLMDDEDRRTRLARDGRVAVSASFTDSIMAEKTWELCCRVCASQ